MFRRFQRIAHQQRARHRAQQGDLLPRDDAVDGDTVVAALANLVVGRAGQHRLDMAGAETLPGAIDGGQIFACRLGRVDAGRGRQAIVAIAAGGGRVLAEMAQQNRPTAGGGFDEGAQRRDAGAFARLAGRLQFGDAHAGTGEILRSPEEMRDRRLAIAAGAARFLIIALDRLGQAGMGDEAHVGLVDTHAEGDGGDHHHIFAGDEGGLIGGAHRWLHAGMIGAHGPPAPPQRFGELLRRGAGLGIDDAGTGIGGDEVRQLAGQAIARMDGIADIGPVEAGDDEAVARDAELDEDILARVRVRGGGERQARDIGKFVQQRAQQAIVGAKIMAPFGHAMGFVDGEEGDLRRAQQVAEIFLTGAFGRDIEQIEIAIAQAILRFAPVGVHAGQAGGAQAHRIGGAQLVVHQRDQRRHDDAAAVERGGRQLIA